MGMKDTNRVSAEVFESADGLTLEEFVLDRLHPVRRSTRTNTPRIRASRSTV